MLLRTFQRAATGLNIGRAKCLFSTSLRKEKLFSGLPSQIAGAPLDVHPEVADALASKQPVVALETTLITHGIPYPTNVELSVEMEDIVRNCGAVPATIGLIAGQVKIGLNNSDLERLARRENNPVKVSRRDIGPTIISKLDGGTTCSATLIFAAMAGIKVFATGGLGGVHRGGESSMDISADLFELTRCPVGLVSSGIKSILDIRRTLEYLETLGVPVISYARNKHFPAFFTRQSGCKVPWNFDNPTDIAQLLVTHERLGLNSGTLIAVPIPEEHEADGTMIQKAIDQAVTESEANGMSKQGGDATPWLLRRISELTNGTSLSANIALLKNTALVGAQIAIERQKVANDGEVTTKISSFPVFHAPLTYPTVRGQQQKSARDHTLPKANIVVAGSCAIDISAQFDESAAANCTTAPGRVRMSLGGVARNIADACHRVSQDPSSTLLLSAIGRDPLGEWLCYEMSQMGMRTDGLVRADEPTATCNMIFDHKGDLMTGVADMNIISNFQSSLILEHVQHHQPSILVLDGNLSPGTINDVVSFCKTAGIDVCFEPTSVSKCTSVLLAVSTHLVDNGVPPITFFAPNRFELKRVFEVVRDAPFNLMDRPGWWSAIDSFSLDADFRQKGDLSFLTAEGTVQMAVQLLPFFGHLFIKCGSLGLLMVFHVPITHHGRWTEANGNLDNRLITAKGKRGTIVVQHFPPPRCPSVTNVTGAGDSMLGAILAFLSREPEAFADPHTVDRLCSVAQEAAILTLESSHAVSPQLSKLKCRLKEATFDGSSE